MNTKILRGLRFTLLILVMPLDASALTQEEIQVIVTSLFPTSLVVENIELNPIYQPPLDSDFILGDFNGDGTVTIFAAYNNSISIEVRMIGLDGTLLYSPTNLPKFRGHFVELESVDFDGDQSPEVVMSTFGGAIASSPTLNWIFKWSGTSLNLLTPFSTVRNYVVPEYRDSSFFDTDGDGIAEILTTEDLDGDEQAVTLKLIGNQFVTASIVDFFSIYTSFAGFPANQSGQFEVPDTNLVYRLLVMNGREDGTNRAVSAELTLNGQIVVQATEIDQSVRSVTKTISPETFNLLNIQLLGDPDALLQVTIDRVVEIGVPQPETITLNATKDTFLRSGSAKRNEGANPRLVVRSSGKNRAIVGFDLSAVDLTQVTSARLELTIADNSNNWGSNADRTVDVHTVAEFTEGNGLGLGVPNNQSTRGTGEGATWKCAADLDIGNQQIDCANTWDGGTYPLQATDSIIHVNDLVGVVSWNVTQDVQLGSDNWLIKKTKESQNGRVEYYSIEGAQELNDLSLAPRLVIDILN